jgi:hypothetical protein
LESKPRINQGRPLLSIFKGLAMTARLVETQLWQQNLASLIRSGLFSKAATGEMNGLYTVVGVYTDETSSAPLAKYSDLRRANDAANLVNRLASVRPPIESN